MLFYVFCGFVLQKMLKIEKNCLFLALFPITKKSCKNRQFSLIFCIFCKTNPQNTLNNIIWGWYEKIFEPKILVPWDTPGVTGAPISGGCALMIWPTSVSGHIGPIQPPWHSGMPRTSRKSKPDLQLGVAHSHEIGHCTHHAYERCLISARWDRRKYHGLTPFFHVVCAYARLKHHLAMMLRTIHGMTRSN